MKRLTWIVIPVLVLTGCKKNEKMATPDEAVATTGAAAEVATAELPSLSPDKRAAMLGFARYLPQDAEFMVSLHNGSAMAKRIQRSTFWQTMTHHGDVVDLEDVVDVVDEPGPASLFGEEFTLAVGKSGGEQAGNLLLLNQRLNYYQMRAMVIAYAQSLAPGEGDFGQTMSRNFQAMFVNLLTDPESGVGLLEQMRMPPLYLAFKTGDEDREVVAQKIAGNFAMMTMFGGGQMVVPIEVTRGESVFKGYQVPGAKLAEMMSASRQGLDQMLPAESVDRLIKAVAEKDLVVMSGVHGDYVLMFIGASADDLVLVPQPAESLLAGEALAFCDAYESKPLAAVLYGQEAALQSFKKIFQGGLSHSLGGIRDGLASSDQLGDTRNLQALMRMVEDRESELQMMAAVAGGGTVAYLEDGLKIESFGGFDTGMLDWQAVNRMAPLAGAEDAFLFANFTSDSVYSAKARVYLEALLETVYAGAMKVAELPVKDQKFIEFKNMAQLFDLKLRPDLLGLWDALSGDFSSSLGGERAYVIDFKGSVPPIGVPPELAKEGKFPRLTMVAPVVDRTKLQSSWEKMSISIGNLLATGGEMAGMPIPMQQPLSSEKDGFKSWFFGMPFFNDEFVPSVTLDDEWFAISTSKNQAVDLLSQVAAGGESSDGLMLEVDFKVLQQYAAESTALLEKHPDLFKGAGDLSRYVKGLDELDAFTARVRQIDGKLRTSIHLSTR